MIEENRNEFKVEEASFLKIESGRKLILISLFLYVLIVILHIAIESPVAASGISGFPGLIAIILSIIGVLRLLSGLKSSALSKILSVLLMLVPIISAILLLVLYVKSSKYIKN